MVGTGFISRVRKTLPLSMALAGTLLIALPAVASATVINPVYGYQPKGTVTAAMAVIVRGNVKLVGSPLDASTAKMMVDGAWIPPQDFTATASRSDVYFYYAPKPVLADGPHTFRIEMSDTSGRVFAFAWGATMKEPPKGSWVAPLADSVTHNGYPRIVMSLTDNTPGTPLSVSGQVRQGSATGAVVATFSGSDLSAGRNSLSVAEEIAPGTYFLTAVITDDGGNSRTIGGSAARRFQLSAASAMTIAPVDCLAAGCHVRTGHPATGMTCAKCHVNVYHYSASCDGCHSAHKGPVTANGKTGPCSSCHNPEYPTVKQHTAATTEPDHVAGCGRCHDESFMDRHAFTPAGSAYPNQCDMCHASEEARVQAAMDAGDSTCSACHDSADHHAGYLEPLHESEEQCLAACHSSQLGVEHASVDPPVDCENCHSVFGGGAGIWDATCAECHEEAEAHSTPDHSGTDAGKRLFKAINAAVPGCSDTAGKNRGCHDLSDVRVLHERMPDKGCPVCHTTDHGPARECIQCHLKSLAGETKSGLISAPVVPSGDGTATAGLSVFPADPATRWDKVDDTPGVVSDYDATYVSYDALDGSYARALYTFEAPDIPASEYRFESPAESEITVSAVRLYYRVRRVGTSTLPKIGASLNVGGTYYNLTTPALVTPAATYNTAVAPPYFNITVNPKTGVAWTLDDIVSLEGDNSLREFGLYSTNVTNPIRVTQCYMTVVYNVKVTTTSTTQAASLYHHNNVKYAMDPAVRDTLPEGQRWVVNPAGGWMSLLYGQDCQDKCHTNYWPAAVYQAPQGTYMWHSLAGAYGNPAIGPTTRTLTLDPMTMPEDAPKLEFLTNWRLNEVNKESSVVYVEVSTDGGEVFTPITGLVDGVETSSFTENGSAWVPASYDLSAYSGQEVQLRFRFVAGTNNAAGWSFDDLVISGDSTTVFSDDAETLKPEWTNQYWNRSIGAFRHSG